MDLYLSVFGCDYYSSLCFLYKKNKLAWSRFPGCIRFHFGCISVICRFRLVLFRRCSEYPGSVDTGGNKNIR